MIRVLVAEDHRAAYEAVRVACRSTHDVRVVGYCSTAKQVIPKALETRPDIVLLSLVMLRKPGDQTPVLCGLEVAEELLADLPRTRVLIHSELVTRPDRLTKAQMIGVSNLQSFIASMTQKLTLSDISDESKNCLDKAGITTACLRIKSKWTAGGK